MELLIRHIPFWLRSSSPFNTEIDTPESPLRNQTWIRGKWIRLSPAVSDRYYESNHAHVQPLSVELVHTFHFMHYKLTLELRILHVIFCVNIYPTSQQTKFNEERARLLYHLARVQKFDLGSHIYAFI